MVYFKQIPKILVYLLLILISKAPLLAQQTHHWETAVFNSDTWKYLLPTTSVPNTWTSITFDDSSWLTAQGGFGFGDNDDGTVIWTSSTSTIPSSVYIRKVFNIIDISKITSSVFQIDYDDAFVAYLNGIEIARAGLTSQFPAFNEFGSNHEATMYNGGMPESFVLDKVDLKSILKNGENVLCVQVHNSYVSSTDMSASAFLSFGILDNSTLFRATPSWFIEPKPTEPFSTKLPIVIIDSPSPILNEPKVTATMKIIHNSEGNYNFLTDEPTIYNGSIGIELHGNSTANFPKKPYTIETRNEFGGNNNVALLGMPIENDWILMPYYIDRTLMRNPLAYHMSKLTGQWAPGTRHCEVFLNGDYKGIYALSEKIKKDKNRVSISDLKTIDIAGDELTGGYIYEISGQYNDFGSNRRLRYPEFDIVMPEQLAYIKKYDDDFRALMRTANVSDPLNGYNQWIDEPSFISFLLINEALRNPDGYGWSGFFHKDKLGKLKAGPLWDFDQSAGNSSYNSGQRTDLWYCKMKESPDPFFWEVLLNDPVFSYHTKKTWQQLRLNEYKTESINLFIDSIANILSEAQERNFERWPILGKFIWRETIGYQNRDTYQKEVDYLKQYCKARWEWMDNELAKVQDITDVKQIDSNNLIFNVQLYPNLVIDKINIKLTSGIIQAVKVDIYNIQGEKILTTCSDGNGFNQFLQLNFGSEYPSGIYFCKVLNKSGNSVSLRFIKR